MFKHASDVSGSHTFRYYQVSPMCERANTVYPSDSSLSGGSFTCCNGVYIPRLQEMRAWAVQVWTFPANRMSCSALRTDMRATPGYLWRPPSWNMRTFLRITDPLPWREWGLFSADWVIYLAAYFLLLVFVQNHKATKPKSQRNPGLVPACGPSVFSLSLPAFPNPLSTPAESLQENGIGGPRSSRLDSSFPASIWGHAQLDVRVHPASSAKVLVCFFTCYLHLRMEGEENNPLLSVQVTEAFSPKPCC